MLIEKSKKRVGALFLFVIFSCLKIRLRFKFGKNVGKNQIEFC